MPNDAALSDFSGSHVKIDVPLEASVNDYDRFAPVYDKIMGADIARFLLNQYHPQISSQFPSGEFRALDLACGSAAFGRSLLEAFPHADYVGIDRSQGQIRYARALADESKVKLDLRVGDVLTTRLPEGVDLVTMNLDALNHLGSLDEWAALFSRVKDALRSDGLFLFDVNTPKRLEEDWSHPEVILTPEYVYVQLGSDILHEPAVIRRRLYMEVNFRGPLPPQSLVGEPYKLLVEQIATDTDRIFTMLRNAGFRGELWTRQLGARHIRRHPFLKNRLYVAAYK
jgi:SAM-dependent methyltransferase